MTEGQTRWEEEPRSAKPREGMRVLQVPKGSQASEFPVDHTGVWVQTGPASSLGAWPSHPPSLSVLAAADCITREADSRVKPTSWELQDAARVSLAPPKLNKHPPALSTEQQEAGRPRAQTLPLAQPAALASGHPACCWTGARQGRQQSSQVLCRHLGAWRGDPAHKS